MKSKRLSRYLLLLGMVSLTIGIVTDQKIFSMVAIGLLLISLVTGGRWLRVKR